VLIRKVRALNPWPGTFFYLNKEKIKVLEAKIYQEKHSYKPGTIITEKTLIIACTDGLFQPLIVQRPGKKAMNVSEFLKGFVIKELKL
jgi:methionyl-tRNA formyltransferase